MSSNLDIMRIIYCKVEGFFEHDTDKVYEWFVTPNPMLGYTTPADMIVSGKADKFLTLVIESEINNVK